MTKTGFEDQVTLKFITEQLVSTNVIFRLKNHGYISAKMITHQKGKSLVTLPFMFLPGDRFYDF